MIVPAAISLVLTAVAVLAFVMWSADGSDRQTRARETDLAARAIQREFKEVRDVQESISVWDDAVQYAKVEFNKEWLDNNLGVWLYDFYGYEAAAIYSDDNQLVYTTVNGVSPAPALFVLEHGTIQALLRELRTDLAAGKLERYEAGEVPIPSVRDIRVIGGRPAVVSVMPIVPQTGAIDQPAGTEYVHVLVGYLDERFASNIGANYLLDNARFSQAASTSPDLASYPIFDRSGRVVTIFEWEPRRPGVQVLRQTLPVLGIAFAVAATVVMLLLRRLWKSSAALEAERVEARHQASHDSLTGLPNRARFEQVLGRALADRGRHQTRVSLMMLDLDRFKHINDTLGHHAGDDLIRAVGQRLAALVPPGDLLARLGGDEFGVVHVGPSDRRDATQLARSIVDAISKSFEVSGGEVFVGASIGLAVAEENEHDQGELARRADIALYEAKARGRNRVVVYEEAMNERLQDRHLIEGELREALRRDDQLTVAFQPLYGADGEVAGAEALVRWNHPRLGALSPARFIPVAESSGLIEPLGDFVLRRACAFSAQFPGRRIAVNISPAQLLNPRFPERVFDLLVETAMRPSDLELEITEGILLDSEDPSLEALTTLRHAGIRIALDDFGTGYSSLNYLKRYPVDCIKIDRSFVAQLASGSSSAAIVQAMVTLAHALKIEVTAEGVETHEQLAILKDMGCNLFQGFLLSAPISATALEAMLRQAPDRLVTMLARAS